MNELILHIGYPKTATTYLQKKIFPQVKGLGINSKFNSMSLAKSMTKIALKGNPKLWLESEGKMLLSGITSSHGGNIKIYSDEHWLWGPSKLCPPRKIQEVPASTGEEFFVAQHIKNMSSALRQIGWRLKVLVTLRAQSTFMPSMYSQCASRICDEPSTDHLASVITSILADETMTGIGFLRYDRLYYQLASAVGPDSLHFLFFEDLGRLSFWSDLIAFTGLPMKVPDELKAPHGSPTSKCSSFRKASWTVNPFGSTRGKDNPIAISLRPEVETAIRDTFGDANLLLARILGIDRLHEDYL